MMQAVLLLLVQAVHGAWQEDPCMTLWSEKDDKGEKVTEDECNAASTTVGGVAVECYFESEGWQKGMCKPRKCEDKVEEASCTAHQELTLTVGETNKCVWLPEHGGCRRDMCASARCEAECDMKNVDDRKDDSFAVLDLSVCVWEAGACARKTCTSTEDCAATTGWAKVDKCTDGPGGQCRKHVKGGLDFSKGMLTGIDRCHECAKTGGCEEASNLFDCIVLDLRQTSEKDICEGSNSDDKKADSTDGKKTDSTDGKKADSTDDKKADSTDGKKTDSTDGGEESRSVAIGGFLLLGALVY